MLADMQTRSQSPTWVDFLDAIRIVARLALDDGRLADIMTDEWIINGYGRWNSDDYDDDEPLMVNLYGLDWRAVRPKVLDAYRLARKTLINVLEQGKVAGKGRHFTEKGRREITEDEWSSYFIDLDKGELSHKPGTNASDFTTITGVRISVMGLNEECIVESSRVPGKVSAPKNKGGRPTAVDWNVVKPKVFRLMEHYGDFTADEPEWNAQARLEEKVEDFCDDKFSKRPGRCTIQEHIVPWLTEWRAKKQRSPET